MAVLKSESPLQFGNRLVYCSILIFTQFVVIILQSRKGDFEEKYAFTTFLAQEFYFCARGYEIYSFTRRAFLVYYYYSITLSP